MVSSPPSHRLRLLVAGGACAALVALAAGPASAFGGHEPGCSPGLVAATATPIYGHFEKAHLERSPTQQVADLQATDEYVALHQAWIESFTGPSAEGAGTISGGTPTPFMAHMEHAHIKRAPTDQVADLIDADQYVLTHTVLVENMTQPVVDVVQGAPC